MADMDNSVEGGGEGQQPGKRGAPQTFAHKLYSILQIPTPIVGWSSSGEHADEFDGGCLQHVGADLVGIAYPRSRSDVAKTRTRWNLSPLGPLVLPQHTYKRGLWLVYLVAYISLLRTVMTLYDS